MLHRHFYVVWRKYGGEPPDRFAFCDHDVGFDHADALEDAGFIDHDRIFAIGLFEIHANEVVFEYERHRRNPAKKMEDQGDSQNYKGRFE